MYQNVYFYKNNPQSTRNNRKLSLGGYKLFAENKDKSDQNINQDINQNI